MRTPPALAVFFALALGSGCASVLGADFDRPAPPVTEAGTGTDSGAGSCVDDSLCPGGLHCVQGTCSCDPTSCPGCCNGGTCEPGTEQAVCGAGGVVCSVCGSGTTCGSTCGVCGGNGQACCAQDSCASPLMCTAGKCACMPNCVGKGCRTSDGCNGVCPGDGGCAASPTVVPSNEADVGELEATSLTLSVAPGSTFDTTSDCTSTAILGQCATVPLSGRASMCVCHSDNLTIAGLSIMGSAALTLLVSLDGDHHGPRRHRTGRRLDDARDHDGRRWGQLRDARGRVRGGLEGRARERKRHARSPPGRDIGAIRSRDPPPTTPRCTSPVGQAVGPFKSPRASCSRCKPEEA